MKKTWIIVVAAILLVCVGLLHCWLVHRKHSSQPWVATKIELHQLSLLRSLRVIELLDDSDVTQLRKESESDLFYSINGLIDVADSIDAESAGYLYQALTTIEDKLKANPLKHKSSDELNQKIGVLKDKLKP